mmetsp:Transcript_24017/g.36351  ORF Transcript_24017/g.36351 Transcript_24017/m.36351 type:complete len:396 (-) Transcript_24017:241-1428(-)
MTKLTPNRPSRLNWRFGALLGLLVASTTAFVAPKVTSTRKQQPAPLSATTAPTVQDFLFQGHKVYSEVYKGTASNKKKNSDVILIHGFGCSTVYWRATVETLENAGYTVHALDLLGQGKSAKPGKSDGIKYSIRLWAEQVDEYAKQYVPSNQGVVLMGNSLGSVVALTAAAGDYDKDDIQAVIPQKINGVGMYNCGVGMNSRNVLLEFDGIQLAIFTVLFDVLDAILFANLPLLTYVLDKVVTKELLNNALTGLYKYGEDRVDDELVDSFYEPAKNPGSPECLSQIYTNDPGATPMQIYSNYKSSLDNLPVHLVWGMEDPVTPMAGSVGVFFNKLAADPESKVSIDTLPAGHVPFDEVPECNELMLNWLESTEKTASATPISNPFGDFKLPLFFG